MIHLFADPKNFNFLADIRSLRPQLFKVYFDHGGGGACVRFIRRGWFHFSLFSAAVFFDIIITVSFAISSLVFLIRRSRSFVRVDAFVVFGIVEQNLWLDGPFRFANTILVEFCGNNSRCYYCCCCCCCRLRLGSVAFCSKRRRAHEFRLDGQFPSFPL